MDLLVVLTTKSFIIFNLKGPDSKPSIAHLNNDLFTEAEMKNTKNIKI